MSSFSGMQGSSMHVSELASSFGNKSSLEQTLFDRQVNYEDFLSTLSSTNKEIESTRTDLQFLMLKSHAYSRNAGLSSNSDFILPKTTPRHTLPFELAMGSLSKSKV